MAKNAFITPDFFSVAKELIGQPLASPSKRALAMAIDGLVIAALVQVSGIFLGFTAVFLLWRASGRGARGGFFRESVRLWLRATAAVILFIVVMASYNYGEKKVKSAEQSLVSAIDEDDEDDDDESPNPIRADSPKAAAPVTDSTASGPMPTDSAQVRIATLEMQNEQLEKDRNELRTKLAQARKRRGIRSFLGGLFDDLGLGFGWAAVYFTGFLAMMRGQTPGKRIAGIRVIRLDGKPLGWWIAFERFGGYAASFSVGLLGFLQILWDRNRQGLHDKACETVVVLDSTQAAARS